MDAIQFIYKTGDAKRGSACVVQGHRITMEHWSPSGRLGCDLTVIESDLEIASILLNGKVGVIGRDVQILDTRRGIMELTLIAPARICEIPLAALDYIFKGQLPDHLRPAR